MIKILITTTAHGGGGLKLILRHCGSLAKPARLSRAHFASIYTSSSSLFLQIVINIDIVLLARSSCTNLHTFWASYLFNFDRNYQAYRPSRIPEKQVGASTKISGRKILRAHELDVEIWASHQYLSEKPHSALVL